MFLSQYRIFKATLCCFLVSLYLVCAFNINVTLDTGLNNGIYIKEIVKLLVLPMSATEQSDIGRFADLYITYYSFIY